METTTCEILRLPEELLAAIVSLTSPPDACRAAAVSRAFRVPADSDAVWSCFLPSDLPQFAEGELQYTPPSTTKKGTFLRLTRTPVLLPCRLISMRLDKFFGAKCYMLSARALHISWGDTPEYWTWFNLRWDEIKRNKRFSEAAKLAWVCWLEIRGKIHSRMLSKNSKYGVYMVFKLATSGYYNLDFPFQEASVSVGGSESTRKVCLQGYMKDRDGRVPQKHIFHSCFETYSRPSALHLTDDLILARKRTDGWMELELGEFYNEEGYDGEVSVSLMETKGGYPKCGLVVWGIEIRIKQ